MDANATHVAAALAFYTLLSMAPLVVLCISIARFALGEEAARAHLVREGSALITIGERDGRDRDVLRTRWDRDEPTCRWYRSTVDRV